MIKRRSIRQLHLDEVCDMPTCFNKASWLSGYKEHNDGWVYICDSCLPTITNKYIRFLAHERNRTEVIHAS